MKTLAEIRARCVVTEDGHWLWRGALRPSGRANIYAPDYTLGGMKPQVGMRAVWHIQSGKPVPKGWRVFGTCDEMACVAPDHIVCRSDIANGAMQRRTGALRGKTRRILASRATGRARSKLTPELITEIQSSPETGEQLAQRLRLSASTVSKARRGEARSFQGAGIFSGLLAANDHGRRSA